MSKRKKHRNPQNERIVRKNTEIVLSAAFNGLTPDNIVDSTSGLTLEKLMAIKQNFMENEVSKDTPNLEIDWSTLTWEQALELKRLGRLL